MYFRGSILEGKSDQNWNRLSDLCQIVFWGKTDNIMRLWTKARRTVKEETKLMPATIKAKGKEMAAMRKGKGAASHQEVWAERYDADFCETYLTCARWSIFTVEDKTFEHLDKKFMSPLTPPTMDISLSSVSLVYSRVWKWQNRTWQPMDDLQKKLRGTTFQCARKAAMTTMRRSRMRKRR